MSPRRIQVFINFFVLISSSASGQMNVQEVLDLPQPPADHRIPYGPDPLQFGDLYLPEGDGPFPLLVFIHGGCWYSEYTLSHVSSLSDEMRRSGVAVWSIEYRKSGDPGGVWPATYRDVALAVDHVKKLSNEFPLDATRVVVAGHSAGGYLALWVAGRRRLGPSGPLYSPNPLQLEAVIALAGAGNMRQVAEAGVCGNAVPHILGGTPEEVADHYRDASPEDHLPLGVSQFLIFGENDPIVRPEFGRSYVEKALSLGDHAELIVLPGAGHFEMIAPGTDEFERVRAVTIELLGLK